MSNDPNDRLITRDPDAMAHRLEEADYAGADPNPQLGDGEADLIVPASGLGVTIGAHSESMRERDVNPNPQYTPPSQMVATHPLEGVADMPEGAPGEQELARTRGLDNPEDRK